MSSTLLLTAAAADRVELAGCDLADVCRVISDVRNRRAYPQSRRFAVANAKSTMANNKAISAVVVIVMAADDSIDLIKVGKRGGVKRIVRLLDRHHKPV
jgi:hypothetical protein